MSKKTTYKELKQRVKELEAALGDSGLERTTILDLQPHHSVIQSLDNRVIWANRAAFESVGMSQEDLTGRYCYEIWPQRTDPCPDCPVVKTVQTGKPQSIEKTTPDGKKWHIRSYPMRNKRGQITRVLKVTEDITEHSQTVETLRESKRFLKEVFDAIRDGISVLDINLKIVRVNSWMEEMYPKEGGLAGRKCYEVYQNRDTPCPRCPSLKTIETGKVHNAIVPFPSEEDPTGWIDLSSFPLKNVEGDIVGVIEYIKDITRLKQADEALRESEKKYRTLLETTSEGCWIIDPELKTVEVNQSLCKMLGYRQDEMIGKTPFDFVDDENRKIFIEQTSKIPDTTHRSYEITLKKKNGQDLQTYFNATTLRDKSGAVQGSFAFVTDITQRKKAEEERDHLSVAIEQAAESVFIADRHGTIQYVNPAFERITGYSRKDAIGQNPRILKSGKQDDLFYKQMWDTLTRGHSWKEHFINRKKDGSLYEADATISPVLDKSGNITHFVSIKRDVTHEIELEKQLIQAQKMESIGTLAGGIAHDFNNILGIIIGNAELAVDDVPDRSFAKECLDEIRSASLRASALVKQILSFARKSLTERNPVQIIPIIKDSIKLLRASIPTTIEISQDISCEFDTVLADPTQISQVLMNLCTNAAHAMSEHGGVLKVTVKCQGIDNPSLTVKNVKTSITRNTFYKR